MKPLLLIACSANKHRYLKSGRADEIYVGTLLRAGIVWAEENDHDVWILSAKYGWIRRDTIIETYNQKRKDNNVESWPEGEGFYLGGSLYFGQAPDRFKPLVPPNKPGYMAQSLIKLLREPNRVKGSLRKLQEGSVKWYIQERLLTGEQILKCDLLSFLSREYPLKLITQTSIRNNVKALQADMEHHYDVVIEDEYYQAIKK